MAKISKILIGLPPPSFRIIHLTVNTTDEQLHLYMRQYPDCQVRKQFFQLAISGYDKDPRDLYQIPEVLTFFQKLVEMHFIGVLQISTQVNVEMPIRTPALGALEVWMYAKRLFNEKGEVYITHEMWQDFKREFQVAERVCYDLSQQPPAA